MKNDRSPYWNITSQVMSYAVDVSTRISIRHRGRTIRKIDEQIFIDELYVRRADERFEEDLIAEILNAGPIVCLAARRGCGKTSALRFATREISRNHPEIKVVVVDIKRAWNKKVYKDIGDDEAGLQLLMRRETSYRLFPS